MVAEREFAPAKVNLYLHVRGRRADGFHLLDSLVVFPGVGDWITAQPGHGLSLNIQGAFGDGLDGGPDNLVMRAAMGLGVTDMALTLEKNLPVASGIGGGSSDAAAALRLLARMRRDRPIPPELPLKLGADVPVCLGAPQAAIMGGIGECLRPAPAIPAHGMVLVNPGVGVATGAIFSALGLDETHPQTPGIAVPDHFADFSDFCLWLERQRNDLQNAATAHCPAIGEVLGALAPMARLARMSGSGATCFGLYPDAGAARTHAQEIARARPQWWVAAAPVGAQPG